MLKLKNCINLNNSFDGEILIGTHSVSIKLSKDLYARYSYFGNLDAVMRRNEDTFFYVEVIGEEKVAIATKMLNKIKERMRLRLAREIETEVAKVLESILSKANQ